MLVPGLVSVTFRDLDAEEIIDLAREAGLRAVEWGGDVHVPPGDTGRARDIGDRCRAAGLEIGGYGSYHKAGVTDPAGFPDIVATAAALGAPRVRVWAGTTGSAETGPEQRARTVEDIRRCAGVAAQAGLRVTVEHHVESLTDDLVSALRLHAEAASPALVPHWQPRESPDAEACLREVTALLPRLESVHAFSWGDDGYTERLPLADRADLWRPVLGLLAADGARREVLLEFVQDDSPEALLRDAADLRGWIAGTVGADAAAPAVPGV
ncbi:sugar phosphate isomerase/epimerase family protein [Nocardiopsis sediminis]|uniref:Sugar phosphate isomerase/epimerase family protein n=1 Tax=Nocardiopsis sediminis TaxID=1778267 RepID=A0ABV8FKD1_9ACTN